ncbi:uncharacterized protein A4U43_C06F13950 [Asparagus officinalis]|uniref:Uncharacterized protein n=1 Tax=Asparagus officinalis TaxID=4686 RepID=A0A5P1EM08_ASPOF|nr:uncharacterized protein A4U43_C06F13950 [Asparagus officinalis]
MSGITNFKACGSWHLKVAVVRSLGKNAQIYLSLILNDNISLFLNDNIDGKGMHDGRAKGNRSKKVKSEDTCDHSDKGEEDVEEEEVRKNRLGLNKKSGDDDELIALGKSYGDNEYNTQAKVDIENLEGDN